MSRRGLKLLSGGEFGVGEEVAVDDVGESPREGAHGWDCQKLCEWRGLSVCGYEAAAEWILP